MKKIKLLLGILLILIVSKSYTVNAVHGQINVYYAEDSSVARKPTYTYTKEYMSQIGYTVNEKINITDHSGILLDLKYINVAVLHFHGRPGVQYTGEQNGVLKGIAAKKAGDSNVSDVSTLNSLAINKLKLILLYGCQTGISSSTHGNLPDTLVKKGAQVAVAWKTDLPIYLVNEWNRLFFEKAREDNIVESFRHADYWLRNKYGTSTGDIMALNRNEAGYIYGKIN